MNLKNKVSLFFIFILLGCSSATKNYHIVTSDEEMAQKSVRKALNLIKIKDYGSAKNLLLNEIKNSKSPRLKGIFSYNLATMFQEQGRCQQARRYYKKAEENLSKDQSQIKLRTALQQGYTEECLLNLNKALVFFKKAEKLSSSPIHRLEALGRQGGTMEALGQNSRSVFSETQLTLRAYNKDLSIGSENKRKILSKTLFLMGRVSHIPLNRRSLLRVLRHLKYSQSYLLYAIALGDSNWSKASLGELQVVYQKIRAIKKGKRSQALARQTLGELFILLKDTQGKNAYTQKTKIYFTNFKI